MTRRPPDRRASPDRGVVRTTIDLGDRTAPLVARVNRRARRLIVRVDARSGEVLVTAPSRRALAAAIRFAGEEIPWIARELDRSAGRPFAIGGVCPLRGVDHRIIAAPSARSAVRRIAGAPPAIEVGGAPEHVNRRIVDWLRKEARADLDAAVGRFARTLAVAPAALRIRDARTRWGSCGADGVLSFSWRLILAPPAILDYVAAHECAHLVHLDHSPDFWRAVRALGVDPDGARAWFDAHGAALHAFGIKAGRPSASHLAVDDDGDRRRRRV